MLEGVIDIVGVLEGVNDIVGVIDIDGVIEIDGVTEGVGDAHTTVNGSYVAIIPSSSTLIYVLLTSDEPAGKLPIT